MKKKFQPPGRCKDFSEAYNLQLRQQFYWNRSSVFNKLCDINNSSRHKVPCYGSLLLSALYVSLFNYNHSWKFLLMWRIYIYVYHPLHLFGALTKVAPFPFFLWLSHLFQLLRQKYLKRSLFWGVPNLSKLNGKFLLTLLLFFFHGTISHNWKVLLPNFFVPANKLAPF